MSWQIHVEYDSRSEIVHASFTRCVLVSSTDVEQWKQEMEEHLSRFGRGVDLILDLDGLEVSFTAGRLFRKVRGELLERYVRRVCSYGGDEMTRMFFTTTGHVLRLQRMPQASTRGEAVSMLRAA